jgi:opacity protein-like surface antigen
MMSRALKRFSRNQGLVMRRRFVALFLVGLASNAGAGEFDVPTLRGSSPFVPQAPQQTRWSGFYFGAQAGYGVANIDYAGATQSLIAYSLRELALENESRPSEWGVLGSADTTGKSFGGFVGYNSQWEDVIVGIDLHYNRSAFFSNAPLDPLSRVTSAGGNTYAVTVTGDASMRITDFGSARMRAGWIVGNFLPYATLGFAIGRADVTRSATVSGAENPPTGYPTVPCDPLTGCVPFSFTSSESKKGAFIYGWSAGGGIDMLLMKNLFLRAEYEYVAFAKSQGIAARINTARFGAGVKF